MNKYIPFFMSKSSEGVVFNSLVRASGCTQHRFKYNKVDFYNYTWSTSVNHVSASTIPAEIPHFLMVW